MTEGLQSKGQAFRGANEHCPAYGRFSACQPFELPEPPFDNSATGEATPGEPRLHAKEREASTGEKQEEASTRCNMTLQLPGCVCDCIEDTLCLCHLQH